MNVKYLKWSILISFSLALMVLCLSDTRGWAGPADTPGEEGWWFLLWRSYQGVRISQGNIEDWHERGSFILQNVDDVDDVSADVTLMCTGFEPNFLCDEGTAEVTSKQQIYDMVVAMSGGESEDPFDALVLNSIYLDGGWCNGYFCDGKIFIISSPGDNTLAHEVGHWATCPDITTQGEEARIMFEDDYSGNELRSYEAGNYEYAAQPPEKK